MPVLQPVYVQMVRRLWEACHYTVMRLRCQAAGLQQMAAKQATSLLRYIGDIPADKAFYEAGGVPDSVRLLCGTQITSGTQGGTWWTQQPACGAGHCRLLVAWSCLASSHCQQMAPVVATAGAQQRLHSSAKQPAIGQPQSWP